MSYDGWIELPTPGAEPTELASFGNYTSNVSPMWRWCLSIVTESPLRLSDTDGWTCEKAAPALAKAVTVMEENHSRLSQLNPKNGWGDYDGALKYLRNVTALTERFSKTLPTAYLRWWA